VSFEWCVTHETSRVTRPDIFKFASYILRYIRIIDMHLTAQCDQLLVYLKHLLQVALSSDLVLPYRIFGILSFQSPLTYPFMILSHLGPSFQTRFCFGVFFSVQCTWCATTSTILLPLKIFSWSLLLRFYNVRASSRTSGLRTDRRGGRTWCL